MCILARHDVAGQRGRRSCGGTPSKAALGPRHAAGSVAADPAGHSFQSGTRTGAPLDFCRKGEIHFTQRGTG